MSALEMLAGAARDFQADVLRGFCLDASGRESVSRFLGLKITKKLRKDLRKHRYRASQDNNKRFRQRQTNASRQILPLWDIYTKEGDHKRTRGQHEAAIKRLTRHYDQQVIEEEADAEPADSRAHACLLNMLAKVNPAIETVPAEGYPETTRSSGGYGRKLSSFTRLHRGSAI